MTVIFALVAVASVGSLFLMCSVMVQYATELEQERKFILQSSASVREALSEFSITTESLSSGRWDTSSTPFSKKLNLQERSKVQEISGSGLNHFRPPKQSETTEVNAELGEWTSRFLGPSLCEFYHRRNIFHLHMRKAAGTTIRNYLQGIATKSNRRYIESEGTSISAQFNYLEGITTVVSLRHPIDRIFSMYWYEHVAWWSEIKKDMSKCSTMKNWVEAWRDGSKWKSEFMKRNPSSTYVEIENYFVKTLTGWKGPEKVTHDDLDKAKRVLEQFDVVLLAEWLKNETQSKFLK